MFEKIATPILGLVELRPIMHADARGRLVKIFHRREFARLGLADIFTEVFHTTSVAGTVRGLHFQTPPHDHAKLVTCLTGTIFDVGVDLRRRSPSYGRHAAVALSADAGNMLYLPAGLAHGFCTPAGPATVLYFTTTEHAPDADGGIRWDSAGIAWPVKAPILSDRDRGLPALAEFESPFVYSAS
jgi:dTDP-4-dehydrorhamnose 3,5-epimerase